MPDSARGADGPGPLRSLLRSNARTISGEVKDGSGALLPGASVTVVNKATNATRTTVSDSVGLFDFPALPPGAYSVTAELEGFRTGVRDLELRVQQVFCVNFALELATIAGKGDRGRRVAARRARMPPLAPSSRTVASSSSRSTAGTTFSSSRSVRTSARTLPVPARPAIGRVAAAPISSCRFRVSAVNSTTTPSTAWTTPTSTSTPTSSCRRWTLSRNSRCRPACIQRSSAVRRARSTR